MGEFYDLKTYPWGCGEGVSFYIKGIVIGPFNYDEQNRNLKILIRRLWRKKCGEGNQVTLQSFWSLKKVTRTLNFHSNEPSHDILGPKGRYDHPWGQNQINK